MYLLIIIFCLIINSISLLVMVVMVDILMDDINNQIMDIATMLDMMLGDKHYFNIVGILLTMDILVIVDSLIKDILGIQ